MKRIVLILMAMMLILAIVACGKTTPPVDTIPTESQTPTSTPESKEDPGLPPVPVDEENTVTKPGIVYFPNARGENSIRITGLKLQGNRAGLGETAESATVNARDFSLKDVRCVFEINEWISVYPQCDVSPDDLQVYLVEHKNVLEDYAEVTVDDLAANLSFTNFTQQEDLEICGNLYLPVDAAQPGFYDLVITIGNDIEVVAPLYFYAEGELEGQTDAQLEELMANLKN